MISGPSTLGPRWPALDGLRGLAILMVFAFHLPVRAFRAGSYGVIVFFVLSGFLITIILLRELEATGTVDLRHFYTRRAIRLLPALAVVILAHLILQVLVVGEPERWWERTWPVLAYVSNYATVAGLDLVHMSHTWSLAIEEHFYLLWPVALVFTPARWRFRLAAGLAGAFSLWRLGLLATGAANERIFFATDTNAFAPLLGCMVAIGIYEGRFRHPTRNLSALTVAVLIAAACLPLHFADRRLLWGAIPIAATAALAIPASLHQPASWLKSRVLRWFGKISYGLYLWHYMLISMPWERLPLPTLIPMTVTPIAAAALSWYFLEEPLLRRRQRAGNPHPPTPHFNAPEVAASQPV